MPDPDIPLHRPLRQRDPGARPVDHTVPPLRAAQALVDGVVLRVADHWATGLAVLHALDERLPAPRGDAPYTVRRAWRREIDAARARLLVPVGRHMVTVRGAPEIGFLADLYDKEESFFLSFFEVQGMATAWLHYRDGVRLAVLGHALHPFYGTYVPSRTSHLELFATWLSGYDGPRQRAVDVGTGSGVLALLLARAGAQQILATDLNPNAVQSVQREVERLDPRPPITVMRADLLGEDPGPYDLIVFNPPWTAGRVDSALDGALVFEDGLFARFFDQAHARLAPGGRVVLVFSNLLTLVQPDLPHPIEVELAGDRFELVNKLQRKVKPQAGPDGRKRRTRERVEVWELAAR